MESDMVSAKRLTRLIERIADSDQQAFAEFYDATSARAYGMACRVLVDRGLAEDATQEAYLQVWNDAARYSPSKGSALSWVITIAHRRAIDKVRSEQARTNRERDYGAAAATVDYAAIDEKSIELEESRQVVNCLETLTPAQHESVELAYYRGLTYRQVAERLGAGLPAVKSRIRDGLARLKNCLGVGRHG